MLRSAFSQISSVTATQWTDEDEKNIRTWNVVSPASNKYCDNCDERRCEAKRQGNGVAGGN